MVEADVVQTDAILATKDGLSRYGSDERTVAAAIVPA